MPMSSFSSYRSLYRRFSGWFSFIGNLPRVPIAAWRDESTYVWRDESNQYWTES